MRCQILTESGNFAKSQMIGKAVDSNKNSISFCDATFKIGSFAGNNIYSNCSKLFENDLKIITCLNKHDLAIYKKELEYLLDLVNQRDKEILPPIVSVYINTNEYREGRSKYLKVQVVESTNYSDTFGDNYSEYKVLETISLPYTKKDMDEVKRTIQNLKNKYNITD